jgi:hypothetical protein
VFDVAAEGGYVHPLLFGNTMRMSIVNPHVTMSNKLVGDLFLLEGVRSSRSALKSGSTGEAPMFNNNMIIRHYVIKYHLI